MVQHLSGIPFRGLAAIHGCGVATAHRRVHQGLEQLPTCIDVTRWYCQKFQGILLVDGKYVKVKKHDRKIPVIYGVDYQTHDIPHFRLTQAEDFLSCKKFFQSLKLTDYVVHAVVCDDNVNIYQAAQHVYPQAAVQLCHLHFLRNTRAVLEVEDNQLHQLFFQCLHQLLIRKRSRADFDKKAATLLNQFGMDDVCQMILVELAKKQTLLQGHLLHKGTPTTTNLIESFNSHLQARVKPLKGFENFKHADLWLNGYFLKRRSTKFTDCQGKFKKLNGTTPLSQTQKSGIDLPSFF